VKREMGVRCEQRTLEVVNSELLAKLVIYVSNVVSIVSWMSLLL